MRIGIGLLGHGFMGLAHTSAFERIPLFYPQLGLDIRRVALAGKDRQRSEEAARRLGFAKVYDSWLELVQDPDVDILDNVAPNISHVEPCLEALHAHKHVICEKPLATNRADAARMWREAQQSAVKHMCAFNYRFVPAVRFARDMVANGDLGTIYHFRGRYLQDWLLFEGDAFRWKMSRADAGSGALGDIGCHIIDLMRFLVGEPASVMAYTADFGFTKRDPRSGERRPVDVDSAFVASLELAGGGIGTLEASRVCPGRRNHNTFEVNGSKGSLWFDLEDLSFLHVYRHEQGGFARILVGEKSHPYMDGWWPVGHVIGWEQTFIFEMLHFLRAVTEGGRVEPWAATFEDGYRCAVVCDSILESASTGRRVEVKYEA